MDSDPLLAPLEALLNRNVAGSAEARALAAGLEGRSLALCLAPTPIRIVLSVSGGRLRAAMAGTEGPDASIEGTPLALAMLARAGGTPVGRMSGVRISGDAETAQSFHRLLAATRPDLEEELSRLTGDVVAHRVADAARAAFDFGRRALDTFTQNVGEYLTEESRDLPTRTEADGFLAGVDRLREDVDRLEARIRLLEANTRGTAS